MILKKYIVRYVLILDPAIIIMEADHINVIILKDRNIAGPML